MATIKNYRELEVWKLSMSFVEAIYKALKTFPPTSCPLRVVPSTRS